MRAPVKVHYNVPSDIQQNLLKDLTNHNSHGEINYVGNACFSHKDEVILLNRVAEFGLSVWGIDCFVKDEEDSLYYDWYTTLEYTSFEDEYYLGKNFVTWYKDPFENLIKELQSKGLLERALFDASVTVIS